MRTYTVFRTDLLAFLPCTNRDGLRSLFPAKGEIFTYVLNFETDYAIMTLKCTKWQISMFFRNIVALLPFRVIFCNDTLY